MCAYKRQSPQPIIEGGTNATSMTNTDGVVYYDGTKLNTTTVGTATNVLTSNGAGLAPTFQAAASGNITITGDTGGGLTSNSFTFTGGATGLTFAGAGTTETLGGTVAIAHGGTNATSMATTDGTVYFDGTRLVTTATGTSGQALVSAGAGVAPAYGTVPIAGGGTNATSMTNTDGVVYYDGTRLVTTAVGTATQVLTSQGAGLPPIFSGSTAGITTLNGDTGSATGSTVTIAGGLNIVTSATGSTVTVATKNVINLPATTSSSTGIYEIDSNRFVHAYGATADNNTFLGSLAGNFTLTSGTAQSNSALGSAALSSLTTGNVNTCIGTNSGSAISTGFSNSLLGANTSGIIAGSQNSIVGANAGSNLSGGDNNCVLGYGALSGMFAVGSSNIIIGSSAGSSYVGSESSNILLNNTGTAAESHVLRIGGATGTGDQQLNKAFIYGINGNTVSNTRMVTIDSSTSQLGTAAVPSGGFTTQFIAYANTNTANATGDGTFVTLPCNATTVNNGSAYNTGTFTFTAPATGLYYLSYQARFSNIGAAHTSMVTELVTTSQTYFSNYLNPFAIMSLGASATTGNFGFLVSMSSGDTALVSVAIAGSTKTITITGDATIQTSVFSGFRVA